MCIRELFSLTCTDCGTPYGEALTGAWVFESKEEVSALAKGEGWSIDEEVPNGSKWDFCPRCLIKRDSWKGE